jgi:acyl-[acyl-carrier-protein] desaturase
MTATRAHRETVYRAYMEFFDRAERIRHRSVFSDIPRETLDADAPATEASEHFVFADFRMPGVGIVPDHDARTNVMRGAVIDRSTFLTRVWFPLLEALGTSRAERSKAARGSRESGALVGQPPAPA